MSSCFYLVIVVLFFTSYLFLLTILKLKRKLLFVTDSRHRKSNMLIRFAREILNQPQGQGKHLKNYSLLIQSQTKTNANQ